MKEIFKNLRKKEEEKSINNLTIHTETKMKNNEK